MDIQAYISSGTVEAYVLGIATADEVKEVERFMLQYPELREAVEEMQHDLSRYVSTFAQEPPEALKQQVLARLRAQDLLTTRPKTERIALTEPRRKGRGAWAWAAGIALLLSLGANFVLLQRTNDMKEQSAIARAEIDAQRTRLDSMEHNLAVADRALAVMHLPKLRTVPLAGVGAHENAAAMVYWDGATGDVYLDLNAMPPAPEGKQYQLWAIVDGKPVDAGMYETAAQASLQKMKTFAKADMFAVTIERRGGSPNPSLDQMVVAGKAS